VGRKSRPGAGRTGDGVEVFIVFGILPGGHLEGHGNVLVLTTVITRGFPGRLHGQDTSLGKGNIANGLTFAGEVELLLVLALVFSHGGIIGGSDGFGSIGRLN